MIPIYKLGELVKFQGGGTPSRKVNEYWNGPIPWATVKDFNNGCRLCQTIESISNEGLKNSSSNLIPKGTVIIPTRMALGKAALTEINVAINQDLKAVYPLNDLNPKYLLWFFLSQAKRIETMGKGATVKGVTLDQLRNLKIPLPSKSEQKRIAAILDKADALREKRRQTIAKLDKLLQSVFIDMFGDPATNPKNWKEVECLELCQSPDDIKCGPFGTQLSQSEYLKNGIPLWGIKHVNAGFKHPTVEFISKEKAMKLDPYSIQKEDLVMTRKGTVGNCAIYPNNLNSGIMHSDLLRIRLNQNLCNPYFLRDQLRFSQSVRHQIKVMSSGAIMAGINVTKLKKLRVLTPPIPLQRKYYNIVVNKISRLSDQVNISIQKFDSLFASLQQRAFKGEL